MDEEATRTRRTSVRDDQMDDGLSAFSASRADQGDSGTGTQRPMLRSQTHAEHTRRAPAAQPAAGPHNMRGPLLAPGLHGANAPSAFLHSLQSFGGPAPYAAAVTRIQALLRVPAIASR